MEKYKVFVDTSADMPQSMQDEYNISVLNFLCTFDDKSYVAGEELSNSEFYKMLSEADEIPKTSQTPPAVIYEALKKATDEYENVIYFTISSKASGQYNNARVNAEQITEENTNSKIYIVDTMTFSAFISLMVERFCNLVESGIDIETAIQESKKVNDDFDVYILVDSLKYLQKGGRITKTASIVGELLDIKPVLTIRDGLIEPCEKIRGKKKLIKKMIDLISDNPEFDSSSKEFVIVESNKEYADEAENILHDEFSDDVKISRYEFGPTVGTHIGSDTIAILFKRK